MSEKIYALLLRLYPEHFRRAYGDEAMRLVHERARSEKGFLPGLRLWLDLLTDFAISLPREYSNGPTTPIVAAQHLNGEPSFQLLAERSVNPVLLCLAGMLSAVLFWACITSVARSRTFPAMFRDPHSLQGIVQTDLALARSHPEEESGIGSFCMTANRDISMNSVQPLFTFYFAPPGASGAALIDGKIVQTFRNEQRLSIRADVSAGEHQFALRLDRSAGNTSMSSNDDLKYCQPK